MSSNNAKCQKSHVRSCTAAICDVASSETQRSYNRIGPICNRTMLCYPTVFCVPQLRLIQNTQETFSLSMTVTDLVCVSPRNKQQSNCAMGSSQGGSLSHSSKPILLLGLIGTIRSNAHDANV